MCAHNGLILLYHCYIMLCSLLYSHAGWVRYNAGMYRVRYSIHQYQQYHQCNDSVHPAHPIHPSHAQVRICRGYVTYEPARAG